MKHNNLFHILIVTCCTIMIGRTHSLSMPARIIHPTVNGQRESQFQSFEFNKIANLFPSLEVMKKHPNGTIHVAMTTDDKRLIRNQQGNQNRNSNPNPRPAIEGVTKNCRHYHTGKFSHDISTGSNGGFTNGMYNETSYGFIWSTLLESHDAVGISVMLENVNIPEGVELHVFNQDGHHDFHLQQRVVDGKVYSKTMESQIAFLGIIYKGTLCFHDTIVHVVVTNKLILIVHPNFFLLTSFDFFCFANTPGNDTEKTREQLTFSVAEIGITNPKPSKLDVTDGKFFTRRQRNLEACGWHKSPCVRDIECCDAKDTDDNNCSGTKSQDIEFRDKYLEKFSNAVAKIRWQEGKWIYSCTASLINNEFGRVLLMTANHCISKSSKNLEFYFSERSNKCNKWCDYNFGPSDMIGMKVLATSSKTDFTLFESEQPLPNNGKTFTFLGWNTDDVKKGDRLYRVQ